MVLHWPVALLREYVYTFEVDGKPEKRYMPKGIAGRNRAPTYFVLQVGHYVDDALRHSSPIDTRLCVAAHQVIPPKLGGKLAQNQASLPDYSAPKSVFESLRGRRSFIVVLEEWKQGCRLAIPDEQFTPLQQPMLQSVMNGTHLSFRRSSQQPPNGHYINVGHRGVVKVFSFHTLPAASTVSSATSLDVRGDFGDRKWMRHGDEQKEAVRCSVLLTGNASWRNFLVPEDLDWLSTLPSIPQCELKKLLKRPYLALLHVLVERAGGGG
ncbi:hypothetical protein BD410DRAFT_825648 [Rickenella mellea]|uniref:Uncharacterized protein n=1 Tax=Rickenella mellea TaxID=50990 RepID=A0A4Y7QH05_9AGAM|nr:hypothetical protein BD410DRAFT_825648 [Rickenella mellea]